MAWACGRNTSSPISVRALRRPRRISATASARTSRSTSWAAGRNPTCRSRSRPRSLTTIMAANPRRELSRRPGLQLSIFRLFADSGPEIWQRRGLQRQCHQPQQLVHLPDARARGSQLQFLPHDQRRRGISPLRLAQIVGRYRLQELRLSHRIAAALERHDGQPGFQYSGRYPGRGPQPVFPAGDLAGDQPAGRFSGQLDDPEHRRLQQQVRYLQSHCGEWRLQVRPGARADLQWFCAGK